MDWVSPQPHGAAPTIRPFSHAMLLRDEPVVRCGTVELRFVRP